MATEKKKILIVEDEKVMREVLKKKFSLEGFELIEAVDGAEGLRMAKKELPDIVLLDIVMPKMDGATMVRKMREDKKLTKIPVILLTNLTFGDKVEEAMQHGIYDFLIKTNWKIKDVVEKVRAVLASS